VRKWHACRVVYRVHPALFSGIAETGTANKVPCEVLARLPHPNPFIVFPEPIPCEPDPYSTAPIAEAPVFTGMLVTGQTEERDLCSTDDPALCYLNVALAGRLRYAGQEPTYEERTLTLPTTGLKTAEEMARDMQATISRYNPSKARAADARDVAAFHLAINLLLYVCSSEPDMKTIQSAVLRGRKKNANARRRANTSIVDVGFHVGPALWRAERERQEPHRDEHTGRLVRPHIRRAHWHTYWTGPRTAPQLPELRWLHPIIVRPDDRDKGISTVIPIE
jgi:hypothetical protein